MKKTKLFSRTLSLVLSVLMLVSFAACGSEKEDATTEPLTQITTTEATTKAPDYTDYTNRLTGIDNLSEEAIGKRPVAIMINNVKASLPQYGIASADIMFEVVVEGGITRMMGVWGDYTKVPNVCSVRSCRYYYPILAHGLDAVYICFGSNETLGTPTLERLGIDYFNGAANYISDLYGRDAERLKKYSSEHTAYVKGANIPKVLESRKVRSDYLENKNVPIFKFRDTAKAAGDMECTTAKLQFSNSYYSTFTFDSEKGVYKKQHNGSNHMDTSTGEQLSYVNVFALETNVSKYKDNYIMLVELEGGTGYYMSMGKAQKITWVKAGDGETIEVFDAEGKKLKVNPGNSYIGIISPDSTTIAAQ